MRVFFSCRVGGIGRRIRCLSGEVVPDLVPVRVWHPTSSICLINHADKPLRRQWRDIKPICAGTRAGGGDVQIYRISKCGLTLRKMHRHTYS